VTGDEKYIRRAAQAVDSFRAYLGLGCQGSCADPGSQPTSYSGIGDVNVADSPRIDDVESFWYAEVLKYLCVGSLARIAYH
jgi:mannosyl-oligosaccharide alpha-1,2-mannosidase